MDGDLSTCHGLPKLYMAFKEAKGKRYIVLWLLSIAIAISLLVYLLSTNIKIHFNRSTTYQETVKTELYVPYPAITFCNGNPYSRKSTEDSLIQNRILHKGVTDKLLFHPETALTMIEQHDVYLDNLQKIFDVVIKLYHRFWMTVCDDTGNSTIKHYYCSNITFEEFNHFLKDVPCCLIINLIYRSVIYSEYDAVNIEELLKINMQFWDMQVCKRQPWISDIIDYFCERDDRVIAHVLYRINVHNEKYQYLLEAKCSKNSLDLLSKPLLYSFFRTLGNWDWIYSIMFLMNNLKVNQSTIIQFAHYHYRDKDVVEEVIKPSTFQLLTSIVVLLNKRNQIPISQNLLELEENKNFKKIDINGQMPMYRRKYISLNILNELKVIYRYLLMVNHEGSWTNHKNVTDLFWNVQHNRFLLSCTVNRLICEEKHIEYLYTPRGHCIRFNDNRHNILRYNKLAGHQNIEFVFDLHNYELDPLIDHHMGKSRVLWAKINTGQKDNSMSDDIPIVPGKVTNWQFTVVLYDNGERLRLTNEKSCENERPLWPEYFGSNLKQVYCLTRCLHTAVAKKFGCRKLGDYFHEKLNYCENNRTLNLLTRFVNEETRCKCTSACHTIEFGIKETSSHISGLTELEINKIFILECIFKRAAETSGNRSPDELQHLYSTLDYLNLTKKWKKIIDGKCLSAKNINENMVKLRLSFSAKPIIHKKSIETMPFSTLISNIGGIFGLTFGMSVFTFIELISLTWKYCGNKFKKKPDK
ncbi:hypothetical protein SNEBB_007242 [Seison nebaliae]|nr:hypothetical protein SNEBB_007242 [Seison nebaliae]